MADSGFCKYIPNRKSDTIYFIEAENGLVKIGIAVNANERLADLSKMSPVRLKLIATVKGTIKEENKIHRQFSHLRSHAEWFFYTIEIEQFIKERTNGKKKNP